MANMYDNIENQIYIPYHLFNFIKVVFGEVVDGMDVVKQIEGLGSQSGTTKKKVTIAKCGTL